MRTASRLAPSWTFVTAVAFFICFLVLSNRANAQSQGNNAVYNSSGTCTPSSCGFSASFVDAAPFGNTGTDICAVLQFILTPLHGILPSKGGVIDARGLPGATGTRMTCSASPWAGITSPPPSTILLPATGSGSSATPIIISNTWVLPSNTHLIGEGDGPSGTTIQAASGTSLPTMIQFGSSTICPSGVCTGTSVENLTLDGLAQAVDGIINQNAQNNS